MGIIVMYKDEEFKYWMKNKCKLSIASVDKYYRAILTNSRDLERYSKKIKNIYNINNIKELDEMIDLYKSIPALVEKNKRGNNMYTAALSKYRDFLRVCENGNSEVTVSDMNIEIEIKDAIENIEEYIRSNSFIYKKEELSNLYLSLKTKPFVILAGISGTGKSKLVRLFAEAINAKFKSIPVKPDWNDSTELLGYKNIKDEFVQGELYKIIDEAKDLSLIHI